VQFLEIREYHKRTVPTGIPHNLLPEEEDVPEGDDADEDAATTIQQEDSDELSDESEFRCHLSPSLRPTCLGVILPFSS